MSNEIQLPIYDSVYSKIISEKSKQLFVLNNIKSGVYNFENIQKARFINDKSDENYQNLKKQSKHITWGIDINNKFTGYVYFDIDFQNDSEKELIKNSLIELPQLCALWKSFGGKGFAGLVYCDYITTKEDYKLAYHSLVEFMLNNLGIQLDVSCSNFNRRNTLSFDNEIFINNEFINFNYISQNFNKTKSSKKIDNTLKIDYSQLESFTTIFSKNYYNKLILVDKRTNLPVEWSQNLIYNESIHDLVQYFPENIISKFKSNENNTLGISDEYFACLKINLGENLYIPHGKRVKTLIKITHKLIKMNVLEKNDLLKNSIYNLLMVLNTRCTKILPKKGDKPIYYPIDDLKLNELTSYIYDNLMTFNIEIDKCKSIRSNTFIREWLNINLDYTGDKHPRSIIISEINRLKSSFQNFNYFQKINEILENYPNCTNKDYIQIISLTLDLSFERSKYLFKYFKKKGHFRVEQWVIINNYLVDDPILSPFSNPGTDLKTKQEKASGSLSKQNDTINKIQSEYNNLINSGQKPTQKSISLNLGISDKTVKRYWNKITKQEKTMEKKFTFKRKELINQFLKQNEKFSETSFEKWYNWKSSKEDSNNVFSGKALLNSFLTFIEKDKEFTKNEQMVKDKELEYKQKSEQMRIDDLFDIGRRTTKDY